MKHVSLIALGLAAMVAAYWLGHGNVPWSPSRAAAHSALEGETTAIGQRRAARPPSSAPTVRSRPLPRPDAALPDAFAQLQARAHGGDAAAASRLYRDLARCRQWQAARSRQAEGTGDLARKNTDAMTPAQLRTHQMLLDAMVLRQQATDALQGLCEGADDAMLDSLVANIALAARLGDPDARVCYLGSGPLYDARALLAHPEALRTYRDDATAMLQAGLAAGDWRVVDLLQQAYAPGAKSMLAAVIGADPALYYRFAKLYRLGAEPHRAVALDRSLATAAMGLDSAQIADGDAWAERTFKADFSGTSTASTPPGWDPCAF